MTIQQMFLGLGAAADSYWWLFFGNPASGYEIYNDMHLDSSDNIYATGYSTNGGAGGNDGFATKFDKDGALQWQRMQGDSDNDQWFGSSLDSSNNLWLYGQNATDTHMIMGSISCLLYTSPSPRD